MAARSLSSMYGRKKMMPINISIDSDIKQKGPDHNEIECDDAAVIYSNINGAVIGASKNGDPIFTRDVSVWVGGFGSMPDVYTRLSQGVLQMFTCSENERVNQFNLVNLIQFLIANDGLSDKVWRFCKRKGDAGKMRLKKRILPCFLLAASCITSPDAERRRYRSLRMKS